MNGEAGAEARIYLGSCAWSFESWRGGFYPEGSAPGEWLGFYARRFNAVEVDSTFYQAPSAAVQAGWLRKTPETFRFCPKLPRAITHERRLEDCGVEVEKFVDAIAPLHPRLGVVLVQLPPSFRPEGGYKVFARFLETLPEEVSWAVEFRHPGWNAPRIDALLEAHGVARVWADTAGPGGASAFLRHPRTSPDVVIRLLGDLRTKYDASGKTVREYREILWPRDAELDAWAARVREAAGLGRVFVMVNNHYEGFAPATLERLAARLDVAPGGGVAPAGRQGELGL